MKAFIKSNWREALAAVLASAAIMNFAEFISSQDSSQIFFASLMLFGARALTRNRRAP